MLILEKYTINVCRTSDISSLLSASEARLRIHAKLTICLSKQTPVALRIKQFKLLTFPHLHCWSDLLARLSAHNLPQLSPCAVAISRSRETATRISCNSSLERPLMKRRRPASWRSSTTSRVPSLLESGALMVVYGSFKARPRRIRGCGRC